MIVDIFNCLVDSFILIRRKLILFNMMGELVQSESFLGTADRFSVDLSNVTQGSYIVSLSNGVKKVFSKVLIKL